MKLKKLIKISRLEKIEFVDVEDEVKEEAGDDNEEPESDDQSFIGDNCSNSSSGEPSDIKFDFEIKIEEKIKTEDDKRKKRRKRTTEIPSPIKILTDEEDDGMELTEIDENIIKQEKNLGKRKSTRRKYAEESEDDDKSIWKCKSCKTTFNTMSKYEQHYIRVHSNHELTPCRICSAKFTTHSNLQHHLKTKHTVPVIQATVYCIECNDGFETETDLKKHSMKFHRTFSCDICNKAFGKASTLKVCCFCFQDSANT